MLKNAKSFDGWILFVGFFSLTLIKSAMFGAT